MAWSASGPFRQFFTDYLHNANAFWSALPNLNLETHKVALFGNGVTPDYDCTAAASQYGAGGTWTTANECSTAANYVAGGTALLTTAVSNVAGGISKWDADDTGSPVTWTNITVTAYGCLIYADALTSPVVDQGILAVYFGGPFTTTLGAFTIQWSGSGIYTLDN